MGAAAVIEVFFDNLWTVLGPNLAWQFVVAASLTALLTFYGGKLRQEKKSDIAAWLRDDVASENHWAQSFIGLFERVFGADHWSWRCFRRSAIASLCFVALLWFVVGKVEPLNVRIGETWPLWRTLICALLINVVADYASLFETRLLLRMLEQRRTVVVQAAVIILDAVLTGVIIYATIYLFALSPLYEGELGSFSQILGAFSLFSVFFYSTFLTSIWIWGFILFCSLLRLARWLNIAELFNIDENPMLMIATILGVISFLGLAVLSMPLNKDNDGVTLVDRSLCEVFQDPVCLDVAKLTTVEATRRAFIAQCRDTSARACVRRAKKVVPDASAGSQSRAPVRPDNLSGHIALCDGGDANQCVNVGAMVYIGKFDDPDFTQAAQYYKKGCDLRLPLSCWFYGSVLASGEGVERDTTAAAALFRDACDNRLAEGCSAMAVFYERGDVIPQNNKAARELYARACALGEASSCKAMDRLPKP